jgi:hypothetical protein
MTTQAQNTEIKTLILAATAKAPAKGQKQPAKAKTAIPVHTPSLADTGKLVTPVKLPEPVKLEKPVTDAIANSVACAAGLVQAKGAEFVSLKALLLVATPAMINPMAWNAIIISVKEAYATAGMVASGGIRITMINACRYLAYGKAKAAKSSGEAILAIGCAEVTARLQAATTIPELRKALVTRPKESAPVLPNAAKKPEQGKAGATLPPPDVEVSKADLSRAEVLALAKQVVQKATAILLPGSDADLLHAFYELEELLTKAA